MNTFVEWQSIGFNGFTNGYVLPFSDQWLLFKYKALKISNTHTHTICWFDIGHMNTFNSTFCTQLRLVIRWLWVSKIWNWKIDFIRKTQTQIGWPYPEQWLNDVQYISKSLVQLTPIVAELFTLVIFNKWMYLFGWLGLLLVRLFLKFICMLNLNCYVIKWYPNANQRRHKMLQNRENRKW